MPRARQDTAAELRAEALALIGRIGLERLLAERFGSCAIVGSVDLDLMSWRDIDIYVPVEGSEAGPFVELLPDLFKAAVSAGCTLFRARFNDEWHRPRGDYGSGYYWGLRIAAGGDSVWKLDLWGWDRATYSSKISEHEALKRALGEADRNLILALKHEAMKLPEFRDAVTSHDIYNFVLERRGTSLEQLRAYCAARRNEAWSPR